MTEEEIENVKTIIANPRQFNIPDWFLNRQKDMKTGKFLQLTSQQVDSRLREDLERMKKVRYAHALNGMQGVTRGEREAAHAPCVVGCEFVWQGPRGLRICLLALSVLGGVD